MQQIHKIIAYLIPQQDPEIPDVPEHDLSEEDMMFVSLLYNYILALEAEESVRKLAKRNKAYQNLSILDQSVSIRVKAKESFMKA